MKNQIQNKLNEMIIENFSFDEDGKRICPTGTITFEEAEYIYSLIVKNKLLITAETGVAFGASTVAICGALDSLKKNGYDVKHWGADPCQKKDFNNAAISALKSLGLENVFELLESPAHLALPNLIQDGIKLDFALIDGWHTFDYTLVDFFMIDQMLKPGGYICMHDLNMPSKKKVFNYIKTHRKYNILNELKRPLKRRILSFGKQLLGLKFRFAFLTLFTSNPMLVLQKEENYEPAYDFYSNF